MKIKRIIAAASVSAMCVSSMSALNSGAATIIIDSNSPYYEKLVENRVELEDHDLFSRTVGSGKNDYKVYCPKVFADKSEELCDFITIHEFLPNSMNIAVSSDTDAENISEIIGKYDPSLDVHFATTELGGENGIFEGKLISVYDYDRKPETKETARKIYRELSGFTDVFRFEYYGGSISEMNLTYYPSITSYSTGSSGESYDEMAEKLKLYFSENGLDFSVREYEDTYSVCCEAYPNYPITAQEHLDIAADIYDKLGYYGNYISPSSDRFNIEKIDLYNALDGDANNDGELDIADATLVLQSIGNADKYSLSAQGAYNADVNGSGDVTALDALEIQKIDAGLR
ncbi:MAG: dockerin type I repeat-containing protein [Ruminococcus sp.]|nr:dockerin type I repeat-containing protein [Ruminococcus sp.]